MDIFNSCCMVVVFPLLGVAGIFAGLKYIARSSWRCGESPHCAKCDYNLTGLTGTICPECGTPWQPQTVVYGESKTDWPILLFGWLLCVVGGAVLLYLAVAVFRLFAR